MQTVSKRELNQQTAAVLAKATDTDDVVVTEWGKPRWRISAVRDADTTLARLEREGRYIPPARQPRPWPETVGGRASTADEADALIEEIRGDR